LLNLHIKSIDSSKSVIAPSESQIPDFLLITVSKNSLTKKCCQFSVMMKST